MTDTVARCIVYSDFLNTNNKFTENNMNKFSFLFQQKSFKALGINLLVNRW